jgi:hypothetical protein
MIRNPDDMELTTPATAEVGDVRRSGSFLLKRSDCANEVGEWYGASKSDEGGPCHEGY